MRCLLSPFYIPENDYERIFIRKSIVKLNKLLLGSEQVTELITKIEELKNVRDDFNQLIFNESQFSNLADLDEDEINLLHKRFVQSKD